MELSELEKLLADLRAQVVGLESKITDLESRKKGSAGEQKAISELIASLKADLDALKAAPAPIIPAAPAVEPEFSLTEYFFGKDK